MKHSVSRELALSWRPSHDELIEAAFDQARSRRDKEVVLTIVLKLRTNSRRKEKALLDAQCYMTNKKAAVLEALREIPQRIRHDGAIASVLDVLAQQPEQRASSPVKPLADLIAVRFNKTIAPEEYAFSSHLRHSVYVECAVMIWNWFQRIIEESQDQEDSASSSSENVDTEHRPTPGRSKKTRSVLTIEEVHRRWHERNMVFERASKAVIPFGRHRGKTLAETGKREARWLSERLLPEESITTTLAHLDALLSLDQVKTRAWEAAQLAEHPWWRRSKRQRKVGARRIVQRRVDPPGSPVLLSELSRDDWRKLRDQLREYQQFAAQFKQLREDVDTFLTQKPHSYPSITSVPITDFERMKRLRQYETELRWFRDPFASNASLEEMKESTPAQLESLEQRAVKRLHGAARDVEEVPLQPISFIRTMRPPTMLTTFGLLFGREQDVEKDPSKSGLKYVLAVALHGRGTAPEERFKPDVKPGLRYVNFPNTEFTAPKKTSVMLFPVECGFSYHEATFLRDTIRRQRKAQREHETKLRVAQDQQKQPSEEGTKTQRLSALPDSVIGELAITSHKNAYGRREFFAHLPVKIPLTPLTINPSFVVGIHEHRDGYSYALLTREGRCIVGDVAIPPHVQPKSGARFYSDNFVYELANSIVKLAAHPTTYMDENASSPPDAEQTPQPYAYLGIEDTVWKKQTQLSRRNNRRTFARPSRKLSDVARYKALQHGLLPTRAVSGVSPTRDCGQCGQSLAKGESGIGYDTPVVCPLCNGASLETLASSVGVRCMDCTSIWQTKEAFFTCRHCGTRRLARYNTAIVVAERALDGMVERYQWNLDRQAEQAGKAAHTEEMSDGSSSEFE